MNRTSWLPILVGLLCYCGIRSAAQGVAESVPMPSPPALPWNDDGACPFEGCAYRQWTANKAAVLYDTWKTGRKQIGEIKAGQKVTGLTGTVITFKPGVIRMDRDLEDQNLRTGDTILTYTYRGEGFSAAWFKGRFYSEFDISFAKWPDGSGCGGAHCAATYIDLGEKIWWAQIKLRSGQTGWVNMNDADFSGVDMLAGGANVRGRAASRSSVRIAWIETAL